MSDADWISVLEKELVNLSSDKANVKLYKGINKQIEDLSDMLNKDVEIQDPDTGRKAVVKLMSYDAMSSASDKALERFLKVVDSLPKMLDVQKRLESEISPEVVKIVENLEKEDTRGLLEKAISGE